MLKLQLLLLLLLLLLYLLLYLLLLLLIVVMVLWLEVMFDAWSTPSSPLVTDNPVSSKL